MMPFTRVRGVAAPLPIANVTTDDIFPSAPATRDAASAMTGSPDSMGPNAFGNMRWNPDGSPKPEFILNQPPYDQATSLVAGNNFGCGSSREHAVWSLVAIGMRCVIAPSFGDIFFGNCFKNGLLPIVLASAEIDRLIALISRPETAELAIDLNAETIADARGAVSKFRTDSYRRKLMLAGWDEIDLTRNNLGAIDDFEHAYAKRRPWMVGSRDI